MHRIYMREQAAFGDLRIAALFWYFIFGFEPKYYTCDSQVISIF